ELSSTIHEARFFLLNPAGIMFGPGVSLSLPGAFIASTADRVEMSDGTSFGVGTGPGTCAAPTGFFFDRTQPAGISVRGELEVGEMDGYGGVVGGGGRLLSLVGGDLDISSKSAGVSAPSGGVDLVSVGSSGHVLGGLTIGDTIHADDFSRL